MWSGVITLILIGLLFLYVIIGFIKLYQEEKKYNGTK